jgi:hypothetical protein
MESFELIPLKEKRAQWYLITAPLDFLEIDTIITTPFFKYIIIPNETPCSRTISTPAEVLQKAGEDFEMHKESDSPTGLVHSARTFNAREKCDLLCNLGVGHPPTDSLIAREREQPSSTRVVHLQL